MDLDRHIGLGSLPVVIIGNPPGFREWISETPRFAIMDPEPDIGHGSLPPVIMMMMIVYWYSFSNHYTRECIHTCERERTCGSSQSSPGFVLAPSLWCRHA